METIKIRYNNNITEVIDNSFVFNGELIRSSYTQVTGRVGGQITEVLKSEIKYINNKPYWKGKEIYEIYYG